MQIQPINNYSIQNKNHNPQFKSAYPVIHWLAETNSSYSPQMTREIAQKFNENIVRRLNMKKPEIKQKISVLMQKISETTEKMKIARSERERIAKEKKRELYRSELADLYLTERVQKYVAGFDAEYRRNPVARGFYNKDGYADKYGHEAAAYIVTGKDALKLDLFGRDIGIAIQSGDDNAIKQAKADYRTKGFALVTTRANDFKMPTGEEAELHVKMETLRNREGEKKSYNILDMRRFPKNGPSNPFALIEWMKN